MYIYEKLGRYHVMYDINSPMHDDTMRGTFSKRDALDASENRFIQILNTSFVHDNLSLLPDHLTKQKGWRPLLKFVQDNQLLDQERMVKYTSRAYSARSIYDLIYDIKDKLVVFSRMPSAFNVYLQTAIYSPLDMFIILNDNIKAMKGVQFPGVLHNLTPEDKRRCDMLDSILRIEPRIAKSRFERILKVNQELMVFDKDCEPATLFLYLARYCFVYDIIYLYIYKQTHTPGISGATEHLSTMTIC